MDDGKAKNVDPATASESEEKTVNVYFGIFFDAVDKSFLTQMLGFNREEEMRKVEETVSDVKSSSTYQTINEIEAYAKMATDILPDNPVSKAVNKASELKSKTENVVDDVFGKVSGIDKAITDKAGDVPTSFGNSEDKKNDNDAEDMVGSRSIISRLEPNYIGIPFTKGEDKEVAIVKVATIESASNYRIYTTGAISNNEVRKPDGDPEISDGERKTLEDAAVDKVINEIKSHINGKPKKSLHFDIFGYAKDPALKTFIHKTDLFKKEPDVNDVSVDHEGKYKKFYDVDEVKNSMSQKTRDRFRNLNKL